MEREVASVGGMRLRGAADTFLKEEEEEEPCWARETRFTLSCSFKTTTGQGERVDALQFGPGARTEECRACKEKALLCPSRKTQHKGTLPMAGYTTQPERYRGS